MADDSLSLNLMDSSGHSDTAFVDDASLPSPMPPPAAANPAPPEGVNPEVWAAFQKFDVDGSGTIDRSELRSALEEAGLTVGEEQASYLLRKYDDDRNADLDVQEFAALVSDLKQTSSDDMDSVRVRLALRSHPLVAEALDAWWGAALITINDPKTLTKEERAREKFVGNLRKGKERSTMGKSQYILIMMKGACTRARARAHMPARAHASARVRATLALHHAQSPRVIGPKPARDRPKARA